VRQLSEFEGVWQLSRQIEDARAGLSGHLQGEVRFEQGQGGLIVTERGQLTYGLGAPLQAERRYVWRSEAGGIAVFFNDERPFHWFSAEETNARHDCPPDLYHVQYDFSAWPVWTASWQVTGPRKDYVMTSRYRPGQQAM